MKKYIILGVIALSVNVMALNQYSLDYIVLENKEKKVLEIDLDYERENGNRGGGADILRAVIYIGNNDEVKFIGNNTLMGRPIIIEIKNKLSVVKKTIVNVFTIKTSDLSVGDTVVIKKRGKIIAEKKVVK